MATIFSKNSIVFAHSLQAQMWLIIIKINIYFTLKKNRNIRRFQRF